MIDRDFAEAFAQEWLDAWNSHDLDRIFEHYADDFEMSSPLIVQRMNEASGVLKGKAAVRPYWQKGLAAQPPLHFELDLVMRGVASITIVYRNQSGTRVAEVLFFGGDLRVVRGVAHHGW